MVKGKWKAISSVIVMPAWTKVVDKVGNMLSSDCEAIWFSAVAIE